MDAYYSPATQEHVLMDDETPVELQMEWVNNHPDAIHLVEDALINELLPPRVTLR